MTGTELVYIAPRNCSTGCSWCSFLGLFKKFHFHSYDKIVRTLCTLLCTLYSDLCTLCTLCSVDRINERPLVQVFSRRGRKRWVWGGGGEVVEPLLPRSDLFKIDKLSTLEWHTNIQQKIFNLFIHLFINKIHIYRYRSGKGSYMYLSGWIIDKFGRFYLILNWLNKNY